jgi:hypothetical protein
MKNLLKNVFYSALLVGSALLTLGLSSAQADTIIYTGANITGTGAVIDNSTFTVPTSVDGASDLLANVTASSSTGNYSGDGNGKLSFLTDGLFGPATGGATNSDDFSAGGVGGNTATYSLGSNPLGYDISDIQVYTGWNDSGRYQQAYSISYLLAGETDTPSNYTLLSTVGSYPTTNDTSFNGAMTELTPTVGPSLINGVADVEITFNTPSAINYGGYREFAVYGTPVLAPEPSTFALLGLGAFALVLIGRRFKASI